MRPNLAIVFAALAGLGIVSTGCGKQPDAPVVVEPTAKPAPAEPKPSPRVGEPPAQTMPVQAKKDTDAPKPSPHHLNLNAPKVSGLDVELNGGCDAKAGVQRIVWDWGDGTPPAHSYFPAKHRYQEPGTYRVSVTTHDSTGTTSTRSTTVTIPGSP